MPDIRGPDKEIVKSEYETGKYTFKQLAEKFNISEGTIKSWAKRDKDNGQPWVKGNRKKVATKTKKVATKGVKKNNMNKEPKLEAVIELENSELTDKQRLFCIYYVKYFNATKAYQKAYDADYNTAMVNGCKLLINAKVKDTIAALKAEKLKGAMLEPGDVLQKYIDIAFSDITDFLIFGQEEIPVINAFGPVLDEDGEPVTKMVNVVKFRAWPNVDGTLISEIGQGKDGAKLKLYDKMKALDWLANHIDLLDTYTKEKLEIEKQKLQIAKIKAGNVEDPEVEDDGFIEALKGEVAEVWSNEDIK